MGIDFGKNADTFMEGLRIMGFGMAGIFLVLLLIFASIKVLLRFFPVKNDK
jgi:Na+-transporting methylmalonyl-CoA/oxaloacetate decarboxylase gamma subunit